MAANLRICRVPGCSESLSGRSQMDECPKCRARLISWLKRSPAEVYDYRRRLSLYDGRMALLMPGDIEKLNGDAQEMRRPVNYRPSSKTGKRAAKNIRVMRAAVAERRGPQAAH